MGTSMAIPDDWYGLLLAQLHAIERDLAALEERVQKLEDKLHETWMGGGC